jgi:hypothetical protein
MTTTESKQEDSTRLFDTIEHAETKSLEAVRKFLDTVNDVVPHLGDDDGPRRKVIDSAFEMTEQLVASSTRLAQNILDMTQRALRESDGKSAPSPK